ncbi:MAG: HD domain-containing protein [Magnetospirillum sp.]|nr:HD domain-containing protein [Magnetospirillum sp.]
MTDPAPTALAVDLDRAVLALSAALDFLGADEAGHSHRVALMAAGLARFIDEDDSGGQRTLIRAGLLHDCGISSTRELRVLIDDIAWEGVHLHCERGAAYLETVPLLAPLAPIVREHHTPWTELERRGVAPELARDANMLFLVDRADSVHAHGVPPGRAVAEVLTRYSGTYFCRDLVEAFHELAAQEAYWFALEEPGLRERVAELLTDGAAVTMGAADIRALAAMFARIIDAKSPYTAHHSQGVARLVRRLGTRFGLDGETLDQLEIAALLHDLGTLRVPDDVLEKRGPLTAAERRVVARHAFDTWEVLRRIFGERPVAQWAAFHHEAVSGRGYPFHRDGEGLPLEARIIAVADVFQALTEARPYRPALVPDEAAALLDGLVFGGRLDRDVVEAVKADLAGCWQAAAGEGAA